MTSPVAQDQGRQLADNFRQNGAVLIKGLLDQSGLALAQEAFEWSLGHPSSAAQSYFPETGATFYQDLFNTESWPIYRQLFQQTALSGAVADLLDTQDLWFFFEQIFLKEGGESRRTPWHQDTSYFPIEGSQLAVLWLNLDPVSRENSLEFVRGSHLRTLYNGSSFDALDDTAPLYDEVVMPRLPNIEAERSAWDIISWAVEPGDAIAFHPSVLHGGAPTRPGTRRRTLSLRFFGDDVVFAERPNAREESDVGFNREGKASRDISEFYAGMKAGDKFRHEDFIRLV